MRNWGAIYLLFFWCFVVEETAGKFEYQKKDILLNGKSKSTDFEKNAVKIHERNPKIKRKFTRREKCCQLGRKVAKIGESCMYSTTLASIKPDYRHFHVMKTRVWVRADKPVIKIGLLRKCKRFKAFYEKCCNYESKLIDQDLRRMIKRLKNYLRKKKNGKKRKKKDQTKSMRSSGN